MFTPTRGVAQDVSFPTASSQRSASTNPNDSSTSFAQQLAGALENALGQTPAGSGLQIDITPASSQDPGARQFVVTVKSAQVIPSQALTAASTDAAAPSASNPASASMMYSGTVQYVPKTAEESAAPITDEADAYWAMQPPEVQVLRDITDNGERLEKGRALAQQGFAIDYDIMIHQQDPYMTMHLREGEGYAWTAGMGQSSAPVAPGLNFPGMPSYDPTQMPAGAIRTTTDFAKGLEDTSPWWGPKTGNTSNS